MRWAIHMRHVKKLDRHVNTACIYLRVFFSFPVCTLIPYNMIYWKCDEDTKIERYEQKTKITPKKHNIRERAFLSERLDKRQALNLPIFHDFLLLWIRYVVHNNPSYMALTCRTHDHTHAHIYAYCLWVLQTDDKWQLATQKFSICFFKLRSRIYMVSFFFLRWYLEFS